MGDTLLYRIPSESPTRKSGSFKQVESFNDVKGFIVASFDKQSNYVFEEADEPSQLHYTDKVPKSIEKEVYLANAAKFLDGLKAQGLNKAVFSRVKEFKITANPELYFHQLCEAYPDAFVYLISSELFGTWLGATPEILIQKEGDIGRTIALAGTMPVESQESWTEKERLEQRYVADYINNQLRGIDKLETSDTEDVIAGPVKHLGTTFTFELENNVVLPMANKLHPTPAVAGFPKEAALKLIAETEMHDRDLYTGYIGVVEDDRSDIYVNLRCANIGDNGVYLFVGGGFTVDSDIEKEWDETENKAKTLLNIMEF